MTGTGYSLVLGVAAIVAVTLLFLGMNYIMPELVDVFTSGVTDVTVIANVNLAATIFGWALFFIILVIIIEVLRDSLKHRGDLGA